MIKINQPVSAIVCAYNEANNIGRVLEVLSNIEWLDEVIVVDDCSLDNTAEVVARDYPSVKVASHQINQGKGGALATGIESATNDLLLLLDADLVGLTEMHLLQMFAPVLFTREAQMSLGVFGKGEFSATNIANRIIPSISGQRAVWKKSLPNPSEIRDKRYGVDMFITRHVDENKIVIVGLDGLSQVTKEEKEKFFKAMKNRVKMYKDIYDTLKEEKDKK